jgi:uncharacterized radical SAM superfamily protein
MKGGYILYSVTKDNSKDQKIIKRSEEDKSHGSRGELLSGEGGICHHFPFFSFSSQYKRLKAVIV